MDIYLTTPYPPEYAQGTSLTSACSETKTYYSRKRRVFDKKEHWCIVALMFKDMKNAWVHIPCLYVRLERKLPFHFHKFPFLNHFHRSV